jgi:hypothetical protein
MFNTVIDITKLNESIGLLNDSIILSACLFGSVYLLSTSLKLINSQRLEKNIRLAPNLVVINGITTAVAGFIFVYISLHAMSSQIKP